VMREGSFPILSEPLLGGHALWAHPGAEIADPTTLLYAVVPPTVAMAWAVLIHIVLAGVGMFLLCRRMGVAATISGWAALAYVFCGPVASSWALQSVNAVAIPWLAYFAFLVGRRASTAFLVGAIATAYALLHPDPPVIAAQACVVLAVVWGSTSRFRRQNSLRSVVGVAACALMLCSAYLLPAWQIVQESP